MELKTEKFKKIIRVLNSDCPNIQAFGIRPLPAASDTVNGKNCRHIVTEYGTKLNRTMAKMRMYRSLNFSSISKWRPFIKKTMLALRYGF